MKKILLASTALILSGGMAAAQGLSIGGQGRMGIQYSNAGFVTGGGAIPLGTSNYRTEARLQLNFAATVQADHGLTFGAFSRVRIQTNNASGMTGYAAGNTNEFSGARVWAEAAGFRLTFGNQDGAITTHGTAMGYLGGCGIGYEGGQQCGDSAGLLGAVTWFNSRGATGVNAGGQQTIHASYTMGDFGGAISTERGRGVAIAARGRFDAITVAAGYQSARNGSARVATASAHYNGGDWGVGVIVARIAAGAPANTNFNVSGNVALGGGNLYGYVGRVGGTGAYGISYGYGLGGGASIVAGAERVTGTTTASVGVVFNF
ncbi:MAG: porin [Pararhodobacter sp.]|nr:porin [Pararhodobacter sp.]